MQNAADYGLLSVQAPRQLAIENLGGDRRLALRAIGFSFDCGHENFLSAMCFAEIQPQRAAMNG
jgi:hypothetical protein